MPMQLVLRLHQILYRACALLLGIILSTEFLIVLLRYGFGVGWLQLQNLAVYAFAALVLLGLPVALSADRHVRVDVFRERQSRKTRRRIDRIGIILLLLPVFVVTAWLSMPDVLYSWRIREGSTETGGLGGLFLVKSLLPLTCLCVCVQGMAYGLRGVPLTDQRRDVDGGARRNRASGDDPDES